MPVTIILILANVANFIWYVQRTSMDSLSARSNDMLFTMGASFTPAVFVEHEYWRLFAAMFLHANFIHLAINMSGLFIFGRILEKPLGSARFTVLYFVSGFFGALASTSLHPNIQSVGASGAIMGLTAFYIAFQWLADKKGQGSWFYRLRQLIGLAVVWYVSCQAPEVDNACHAGGMIAGVACGFSFLKLSDLKTRWCAKDAVILAVFTGLAAGAFSLEAETIGRSPSLKAILALDQGVHLVRDHDIAAASIKLDEAKRYAPDDVRVLVMHASVIAEQRRIYEALDDCDKALKIDPDNSRAQYIRHAIENYLEQEKKAGHSLTFDRASVAR
jgi:rhomboid protease GluP